MAPFRYLSFEELFWAAAYAITGLITGCVASHLVSWADRRSRRAIVAAYCALGALFSMIWGAAAWVAVLFAPSIPEELHPLVSMISATTGG